MGHKWYFVRCQSGSRGQHPRSSSRRGSSIAGLQDIIPQILVPFERVTDLKGGKKRVVKQASSTRAT